MKLCDLLSHCFNLNLFKDTGSKTLKFINKSINRDFNEKH